MQMLKLCIHIIHLLLSSGKWCIEHVTDFILWRIFIKNNHSLTGLDVKKIAQNQNSYISKLNSVKKLTIVDETTIMANRWDPSAMFLLAQIWIWLGHWHKPADMVDILTFRKPHKKRTIVIGNMSSFTRGDLITKYEKGLGLSCSKENVANSLFHI